LAGTQLLLLVEMLWMRIMDKLGDRWTELNTNGGLQGSGSAMGGSLINERNEI